MKKLHSAATIALSAIAFVIYMLFYDILIPGIPNGSYRLAVGPLLAVPALLLLIGQVAIAGLMILFAVSSLKGEKLSGNNFSKSLLVASVITLLFAFTYVIYPLYGPFYYIVFATGSAPAGVIFVEAAWTVVMIAASTLLIKKLHGIKMSHALLIAVMSIIFITVAAS